MVRCNLCGHQVEELVTMQCDKESKNARVCYVCSRIRSQIDPNKPSYTSRYIKIVDKDWGCERWFANSPLYCGKYLDIITGTGTSIHHHKHKFETMSVISGKFRIMLEGDIFFMNAGDILNISPYQIHKIDAVHDDEFSAVNTMLEVSTQHFDDDSIRHGRDLEKYLKSISK